MSRRALIVAATLVAALGLAVAACGGDDEEAAEPPAEQPAEPTPPAEEPPAEEPPAEGAELQLAADPGGGLAFDQTELSAPPGSVSIVLTNDSEVPHNVAIEGGGEVIVEGEVFQGGGTRTTTAELEAGEYVFFCSVPGHRDAGMEGTLTVG
jgi:plastocyanin